MGKRNGPYNADFPRGTLVRIAARPALEKFMAEWKFHNPLGPEQLSYAGSVAAVRDLGYYHGGDELYWLDGVPGRGMRCVFSRQAIQALANKALQRTRGLSAAQVLWFAGRRSSVQAVSGRRSPLNAVALASQAR